MTRKLFGKEWILTSLCKGIQGRGFRIPSTTIQILWQWNVDSGFQTVAEFWIPIAYSGFQSPGLRIPEGKHYPDSGFLKQKFPDSGIRITLHGSKLFAPIGVLKKTITPIPPASDAACLSSIMGCPGGTCLFWFTRAFQAKRELQCKFLGKKVIIITSKHGTTIFFPNSIFF